MTRLEALARGRKPHKYRAKPTVVDGVRFDSKAEARRYSQLKWMQSAGQISGLALQPKFDCVVEGKKICAYKADFEYWENGRRVTEDVKGFKTQVYRIKKKLVEALHGIEIREVQA